MADLKPVTPGVLLREESLAPIGISQHCLAREIGFLPQRINQVVAGKRVITADTDLRLCRYFGLSNGYWLRAQATHDTEVTYEALGPITPWQPGVEADRRLSLRRIQLAISYRCPECIEP